ncbi:hypothetical protein CUMW_137170 [Citrus unshiu]|uniref:acid phosphatase n=3 Tax=Citrus TaxID=2706 RepID=A0A2H5PHI6_CITUN|nr:hypothetical protein CUMW_137170 [Citrus unshiu]
MSLTLIITFIALLGSLYVFCPSSAELPWFEHPAKPDGSLSFLVVGDWGRRGAYNQTKVAHQMGIVGEKLKIDFIISTGDNFYDDGLTGVDDAAFFESFVNIYTAPSLAKQWYNVLGNHDYRGDVEAQLSPVLRDIDSRWLCLRSFIVNAEIAEFIFVDTTPFVNKYFTDPEDHVYDWNGIQPRKSYLANLLKDVDSALKESTAKWKIVVGHHTIKSSGHHGNTHELNLQLLPILQENEVDLYINGHDHCLERISSTESGIQFLTSGGGSKAWKGDIDWWNPKEDKFYYDGQGFMSVQITPTEVDVAFYDIFGNVDNQKSQTILDHQPINMGMQIPFKKLMLLHIIFIACLRLSAAELQRFEHRLKHDGSLSFLVVGDWGRRGSYNQSLVAYQMGLIGEKLEIDFVISTGDNFYEDGLTGEEDPAFLDSFTSIYTAPSLQKQWYNVLGNHDYRGDVEAQLSPVLTRKDSRWLCSRSFILDAEIAEFVFVDTTPFVDEYFEDPGDSTYDWRGVYRRKEYLSDLLKDVDGALKNSKAKWKIVVGHHTIKSAGHHGVTKELLLRLLPILEENNVDMYVNGHDHCLQHISSNGIEFLTSGGGSKAWRGDRNWWSPEELKLYYDGQGFMSVKMTRSEAVVLFYDVHGNILHKWSIPKEPLKAA